MFLHRFHVFVGIVGLSLFGPTVALAQALFVDGFETGTLLESEAPAGKWTSCFPTPCDTMSAETLAARADAFGLRMVDEEVGEGRGVVSGLKKNFTSPIDGDLFLRTWIRFDAGSDEALGISLVTVQDQANTVIQNIRLQVSTRTLTSGGTETIDGLSEFVTDGSSQVLSENAWHLAEIALLGLGTSQGRRRAWVDRVELPSHPVDWSGSEWTVGKLVLGQLTADRAFTGTLDYDGVAVNDVPPPSHLVVVPPAGAVVDGCASLTIEARDTLSGAPASALSPMQLTVRAQGAGNLYDTPDCSSVGQGNALAVTLAEGESARVVSFQPLQRVAVQFWADHPDLLPGGTTSLPVTGPPVRIGFPQPAPIAHPGTCSPPVALQVEDDAGLPAVDGVTRAVTLRAPVPLFADPECTTAIDAVTVGPNGASAPVHFRGDVSQRFALEASSGGLTGGQQEQWVSAPEARIASVEPVMSGAALTLDGSASAASEGAELVHFHWVERAGPTGVLLAERPVQTVTLTEPGDYVFELSVADSAGLTSSPAQLRVHVEGDLPPHPPIGGCAAAGIPAGWLVLALRRRFSPRRRPPS